MGFWDAVGDMFTSAKCFTGFHAGDWSPEKGKPECNLIKVCPDCDKTVKKTKHKYGAWVTESGKPECRQMRVCVHCNEDVERKVFHQWSSFTPRSDFHSSCIEERRCQCCNLVETRKKHSYVDGEINEFTCKITQVCSRCKDKRPAYRTEHKWGQWHFPYTGDDKSYKIRECQRCGKTETLKR